MGLPQGKFRELDTLKLNEKVISAVYHFITVQLN